MGGHNGNRLRIKKNIPVGMPKSLLSISLSLLLAATSVYAAPAGDQTAGEVKALIPGALRNAQPVRAKDTIAWNDRLKTDAQGRLRAGLTAGSILSLGSNSELQVVQHDAVSQQTLIAMNYGKLRNQVVKITKPDGKYEVKTPNAVIGVTGTDFYVGYENNLTTVIVYSGTVEVTPEAGAKVIKKDEKSKRKAAAIILFAGQMVVIGGDTQPEGYLATATPPALAELSIQDTNVPEELITTGKTPIHWLRRILIISTVVGVGTGVGIMASGGGSSSKSTPPPPPAPTIIDFTNQFGTVHATNDGIITKGSELQNYNGIAAPANKSLGTVIFSAGAFTGANILTGGTFSSAGSSFAVTSGPANYGQPPKGPIFTGSFTGPVTWTLVSQPGKYTDNFTLSGAFSGKFYTGATVTGTTTQNITLYTNQWAVDHEALIRIGKGQFSIPAVGAPQLSGPRFGLAGAQLGSPEARLNALARKSMRHKSFGWTFRF
jgi:hypothetical protein